MSVWGVPEPMVQLNLIGAFYRSPPPPILFRRLRIMTLFTHGLMVRGIPEHPRISLVRYGVVYQGCYSVTVPEVHAKRMVRKK